MKSFHQIASDIVESWPHSVYVKSSDKVVLIGMIAEELVRVEIDQYKEGHASGFKAGLREKRKAK